MQAVIVAYCCKLSDAEAPVDKFGKYQYQAEKLEFLSPKLMKILIQQFGSAKAVAWAKA